MQDAQRCDKPFTKEGNMFLEEYKQFLLGRGKKPGTAKTYVRKLQDILDSGFSVNDLIGAADRLIERYSPGGKDHGNTVAALKQLNEFILADVIDTLYIRYVYPHGTFSVAVYTMEYTIENRRIIVQSNKGKPKSGKIADADYYALVKLLKENEKDLSDASSLYAVQPTMLDHSPGYYDYRFGEKSGSRCPQLFADNEQAKSKYDLLLAKILKA